MRIIAGKYGGRWLDAPKGKLVRPTGDKVKGAMFNILNNIVDWEECTVMDLFCGSGNLGIEALSRGAKSAAFIDKDRTSVKITRQNLETLGEGDQEVLCADAMSVRPIGVKYNLIFMDPPYDQTPCIKVLEHLHKQDMLGADFIAVLEMDIKTEFKCPDFCEVLDERLYGKNKLVFVRAV